MKNIFFNVILLYLISSSFAVNTFAAEKIPHNIILFIPDGLRAKIVDPQTAPTMTAIRDQGVNFANSHSLFPTFTMPNASAMASGHYLGDTGTFSNTIFSGYPVSKAGDSVTPFIESDPILGDIDEHFSGDYLNEETILKAARNKGYSTAAIGKLGPTLMFDHTNRTGTPTIIVDDSTGSASGIPLSAEVVERLKNLGLDVTAPSRGNNGKAGNASTAGTVEANINQQNYFADVATRVVLPLFKARNKPFILVFWSRDPDGTQHNHGDSLNQLTPGINGPTSFAAIKNADDNLTKLRATLSMLGMAHNTNIIVAADHGFSTISKQSAHSAAAQATYSDVPVGFLPPGFLAIDLSTDLGLPLFDPDNKNAPVAANAHSSRGNGLIGSDPTSPDVIVAANGGSDLVYLPKRDKQVAARVIDSLLKHDYVSGIFVDDSLGKFKGTLSLSAINLKGTTLTPVPTIVVNFRSEVVGDCKNETNCGVEIADSGLQQGQGMHGSFSRADTFNFMAAIGPDFKTVYVDQAPVSNADIGKTIAQLLYLHIKANGKLAGRVLNEALPGGKLPKFKTKNLYSEPADNGLQTILNYQLVGQTRYFDAAGFKDRTVGLSW